MTWTLLHDRMAFMAEVIKAADTDPQAALALIDNSSEVPELFGDEEGLMLSLGQRWITMLVAKLDQAAYEARRPNRCGPISKPPSPACTLW